MHPMPSDPWLPGSDGAPVVALSGLPADARIWQQPLGTMSWETSVSANRVHLRFGAQVQGAFCLHPTWQDLDACAPHLRPAVAEAYDRATPGSLPQTAVSLAIAAPLIAAGGIGRTSTALMLGLGSGIGAVALAHHCPRATLHISELDPLVVTTARSFHPLLDWLAAPVPHGAERISIRVEDGVQTVERVLANQLRVDALMLDVYDRNGVIPPVFMSPGFVRNAARALAPDGVFGANLIAPADATWVDGLRRELATAGLRHQLELTLAPRLPLADAGEPDPGSACNRMILAAANVEPTTMLARLRACEPFAGLTADTCTTCEVALARRVGAHLLFASTTIACPAEWRDELVGRAYPAWRELQPASTAFRALADARLADQLRAAVLATQGPSPAGWLAAAAPDGVLIRVVNWVDHARHAWRQMVETAALTVHQPIDQYSLR